MLYKLYSATHRCMPCRMLVNQLNIDFKDWENYIEYIDADNMSKEESDLALKLNVRSLPTITDADKIVFRGFDRSMVDKIKKLCLTKE